MLFIKYSLPSRRDSWASDFGDQTAILSVSRAKPTRKFANAVEATSTIFTPPLWSEREKTPLAFTALLPKQKDLCAKLSQLHRLHQIILLPRVWRFFLFRNGSLLVAVLFKTLIVNSSCITSVCRSFLTFSCLCRPSYRAPYVLHRWGRSGPTVQVHFV